MSGYSTAIDATGVHDLPDRMRRSWIAPLVLGLILVLIGVILLVDLNAGVVTLHWLVVLTLLSAGIEAFATASLRSRPWTGWTVGGLYVLGGLVATGWPGVTLRALTLVAGVSLLVGGAAQAALAWRARMAAPGWGWTFGLGVLSVLGGLILLFSNPVISILALAVALGCYAVVTGATLVLLSFTVRRVGHPVTAALAV